MEKVELSEVKQTEPKLRKKLSSKSDRSIYYLASFFIPMVVMLAAYAIQTIYPFGEKHILTIDLYHQYAPLLRELRDKILSGDSLFYTWTGGLGFNFFSAFTYYLASPFNLLLLLFKESQLSDAVLVITLLKIAFSGLGFYIYASRSSKQNQWFYVAISCSYALSAYSLAYSWNIMWLDTIILLPLLILGLEKLIKDKSVFLYIVSLSLILLTNYYTAFFVCIFLIFYFFVLFIKIRDEKRKTLNQENYAEIITNKTPKRHEFWDSLFRFGYSSILAAGISAVTLLPTIKALMRTSASGDVFPDAFSFFEPFIDFSSRLLTMSSLSIRDGMPNIYIGCIVFLILPLFFINKKIPSATKISHALLMFFLIFSMNNNVFNFIWHGFHYPNQLPFRNSFLMVFLLCSISITAFNNWEYKANTKWYKILLIWIMIFLLLQKVDPDVYAIELILVSGLLIFIYTMILNSGQKTGRRFVSGLLCFVIVIELAINTVAGISSISENEYYGSRDGYKAGAYPEAIGKLVNQIKQEDPNFRASLWPDKTVNDPMLYGYPGITVFASTYPEEPVQFFKKIGYDNNGINSYQNTGSNIILDSIFGLHYKMVNKDRDEQNSFYDKVGEEGDAILYKNKYALPIFYYVPRQMNDLHLSDQISSMNNQKSLIKALGGNQDMLRIIDPELSLGLGNQVTNQMNNKYSITKEAGFSGSRMICYDFTAPENGYYTFSWRSTGLKFDQVYMKRSNPDILQTEDREETFQDEKQQLSRKDTSNSDLGYFEKNEKARITFEFGSKSSDNGTLQVEAALIDENLFSDWISGLEKYSVSPTYHKANLLTAELELPEAGYALFSTTYDSAWNIDVNGRKADFKPLDNALILVPLEQGKNYIRFQFIPDGFSLGLIISGISILIILATVIKSRKNKLAKSETRLNSKAEPVVRKDQKQLNKKSVISVDASEGSEKKE